jgi:RNA polymerase sigma-70 factor, ECF subfamily
MHPTRNRDEADELCQETMLRAFRFFYQLISGTDCRAWLLAILFNTFRAGYLRKRRGEQVSATEKEFEQALENESNKAAADHNPEELLFQKTMDRDVEKALHSLPEEFRTASLLIDVNEFSYEEAACAMEVPIGTVRSRLSRARAMVRYVLVQAMRAKGSARS